MEHTDPTPPAEPNRRARRRAAAAGLVVAGVVGGAVLANTVGASADTQTSSSPSSTSPTSAPRSAPPSGARPGPGGAAPVRSDEQAVTGSRAATLKAAALKAVPGGTVIRVETDAGDAAYEVHMKKADGSLVTVKFDQNLKLTKVESGMGQGDPAPKGAPAGGGPGGVPKGAPGAPPSAAPTSGT
jgi:hypothetical protein